MEVSIRYTLLNKIKYKHIYAYNLQNLYNYMNDNNIKGNGILTSEKGNIILKNNILYGGEHKEIELQDGIKYEYNLDTIEPYSNDQKMISFLSMTKTNENCATIIFDTKKVEKIQLIWVALLTTKIAYNV
jgi:hypothetical protein